MTGVAANGDRVALVTGGTRGIGLATTRALLARGHRVYVNGRDRDRMAEACTSLEGEGWSGRVAPVAGNVASEEEVAAMVEHVIADAGRIDVLVNNAGIPSRTTLLDTDLAHWRQVLDVNLTGTFLVTRAVAPHMIARGRGRVVNLSSFAARFPGLARGAYAASKAAVEVLTRSWAGEFAPHGITVNAVSPGDIRTDIMADVLERVGEEPLTRNIAARRLGTPEEVAAVIAFLVSDDAAYVTGETLGVSGGKFIVQNPLAAWEDGT